MVLRLYFLQDGGITMSELSTALFDATSVQAYPNAIGTFLHKLCKTYKKVTDRHRPPLCQGKAAMRGLVHAPHSSRIQAPGTRCLYRLKISEDKPDKAEREWARSGNRLIMDAHFGSWSTQTLIARLTTGAMIAASHSLRCHCTLVAADNFSRAAARPLNPFTVHS